MLFACSTSQIVDRLRRRVHDDQSQTAWLSWRQRRNRGGASGCVQQRVAASKDSASVTASCSFAATTSLTSATFFEGRTTEERAAALDAARQKFGTQFVVLLNPMYGDWENAVYGYDSWLSEQERAAKSKAAPKTPSER